MTLKTYSVDIGGIPHRMQLNEVDAERLGKSHTIEVVEAKAAAKPANKAAPKPATKAAKAPAKKAPDKPNDPPADPADESAGTGDVDPSDPPADPAADGSDDW